MSLPGSWVKCDRCGESFSTDVLDGRFVYKLNATTQVPIERTIGWCRDCESLEAIEDLDITNIERQIQGLRLQRLEHSGFFNSFSRFHRSMVEKSSKEIRELETLKNYLSTRTEKPHCLNCGSDYIDRMPEAFRDWSHPECGGNFTPYTDEIFASYVYPLRVYDKSGLLIDVVEDGAW